MLFKIEQQNTKSNYDWCESEPQPKQKKYLSEKLKVPSKKRKTTLNGPDINANMELQITNDWIKKALAKIKKIDLN